MAPGDTVAVMLPNTPPMLEAHYGVPMTGAVLNTINIRLEPATIAYILRHGRAKVLLTDSEFAPAVRQALAELEAPPLVVDVLDPLSGSAERLGPLTYEDLLAKAIRPSRRCCRPTNGRRSASTTPRAPPAIPRAS